MSGRAGAFLSLSLKTAEKSEIVFGLIDGVGRISWGGPTEPCVRRRLGSARELGKVGQMTFRSPKGFKAIERRNALTGLVEVEAGIGETNTLVGRACDKRQRKTLFVNPRLVGRKAADLFAYRVEQDRLLDDLAREHLLGESRHEYGVEAHAPRGVDWGDEDFSVALRSGRDGSLQEQRLEHHQDFIQRHWTYGAHRRQLRQHRQHSLGVFERSSGEPAQLVKPFAPVRRLGQAVEQIDERDRVGCEGGEVLERPRQHRRLVFRLPQQVPKASAGGRWQDHRCAVAIDRALRSPPPRRGDAPNDAALSAALP